MPHQRTITIYERIPLELIQDALDDDEIVVVKAINNHLDTIPVSADTVEMSWDELLTTFIKPEKLGDLIKDAVNAVADYRGLSQEHLDRKLLLALDIGDPMTVRESIEDKVSNLVTNEVLMPYSITSVIYWSSLYLSHRYYVAAEATITTLKVISNLELENHSLESRNNFLSALPEIRLLFLKGAIKKRISILDEVRVHAIKAAITSLGHDWITFAPNPLNPDVPSVADVFAACKETEPELFRQSVKSFESGIWKKFNKYRQPKKIAKISGALNKMPRIERNPP